MFNSRSIPPELWEHARKSLIFYFSRRHGISNAEDLAHETLLAFWNRTDYEFEKVEDFLRVCNGFANKVSHQAFRRHQREQGPIDTDFKAPMNEVKGLTGAEVNVFLDEIHRIGKLALRDKDWQLIEQASTADGTKHNERPNVVESTNHRIGLHRARKKLIQITGWRT